MEISLISVQKTDRLKGRVKMDITELKPMKGSKVKSHRHFRGSKTCGKGHKGQNARSGGGVPIGFEGGQMPIYRRLPKKGFSNYNFAKRYNEINVERLAIFEAGTVVTPELLLERGIISKPLDGVVIIGRGEVTVALTVRAHRFSASAKEKIEKAGGTVEVIGS